MSKKQVGDYLLDRRIGKGSYATVWVGRVDGSDQAVAVKVISRQTVTETSQLRQEVEVLRQINHDNIVRFIDLKKSASHFYLVLEYCAGGDLHQFLKQRRSLSEEVARHFLTQIAAGLCTLHQRNLIHRDLKPQNILLSDSSDSPVLKIADFGFARALQPQDMAATVCGSPLYMAPEILRHEPYDAKADLWSVGAILFELLAGRTPFTGANPMQLLANIEKGHLSFEDLQISEEAQDFLRAILMRSPAQRLTSQEFMRHPFVRLTDIMQKSMEEVTDGEVISSSWCQAQSEPKVSDSATLPTLHLEQASPSSAASHEESPIVLDRVNTSPKSASALQGSLTHHEFDLPRLSPTHSTSSAPATLSVFLEAPGAPQGLELSQETPGEEVPRPTSVEVSHEDAVAPTAPILEPRPAPPPPPAPMRRNGSAQADEEYVVITSQPPLSAWARGKGPTPQAAASSFCGNLSRIAHALEQLAGRLLRQSPLEALALLLRSLGLLEKAIKVSSAEEETNKPLRSSFLRILEAAETAAAQVRAAPVSGSLAGEPQSRAPARPNVLLFEFAAQQGKDAAVVLSKGHDVGGWEESCHDKLTLALLLLDLLSSEAEGEDGAALAAFSKPIAHLLGEIEIIRR